MRTALVLAVLGCAACGAPMASDAGVMAPIVDSGVTPPDAGAQPEDAGAPPVVDSGVVQVQDAGTSSAAGSLSIVTYNVAGLPEGLSSSHPATNTPLISPKLNAFELVFAQEDFSFHPQLVSAATHPFVVAPKPGSGTDLGDGLAILSRATLGAATHVKWSACNGYIDAKNDCLTSKGFVKTTLELAPGVVIDVYNLHADAGRGSGDADARDKQMMQLVAAIQAGSAGRALIIAGDTNMKDDDEAQLQRLMTGAGLTDACRALSCPETYRYDRVLFRSGGGVTLTARAYRVDLTFVDAAGNQLSDHEPVVVTLDWSK